ncbi:MAG TPA: SGNH/GDSL hydrolase family protein [Noviherbaspirillum sp.]
MLRRLYLLLAAGFVLLAASGAQARSYLVDYHGDSTVWGFASGSNGLRVARPAPQVFAESLAPYARVEVRNRGVNGGTACALLKGGEQRPSWEQQMRESKADFVILNHGINDQWQYDLPTYRDCLRQLARVAKSHAKQVVFETPNPTRDSGAEGLDRYVEAMREVARQEGVAVIDQYVYLTGLLKGRNPTVFAPDGLHPADSVYVLKGTFAAQAFRRLFRL